LVGLGGKKIIFNFIVQRTKIRYVRSDVSIFN
jgi:hypothetical protein